MRHLRRTVHSVVLAVLTAAASGGSHAAALPKWEAGAGLAVVNLPDYRGADTSRSTVLPLPYLIYRGDVIKADREGVRGTLFHNNHLELNISVNGTLPANSKDNAERRGMADLKPTVEIGPTADFRLWRSADRSGRLDLRLPLRAAVTVEASPRHVGWLFAPNLNLSFRDVHRLEGWKFGLVAGPIFADRRHNAHFYSVSAGEANTARPHYAARAGYAGAQLTLTASKRFPRFWAGAFLRYDTVAGAVFADSPLIRREGALAAGVGVSWIFAQSRQRVEADE